MNPPDISACHALLIQALGPEGHFRSRLNPKEEQVVDRALQLIAGPAMPERAGMLVYQDVKEAAHRLQGMVGRCPIDTMPIGLCEALFALQALVRVVKYKVYRTEKDVEWIGVYLALLRGDWMGKGT